MKHIHITFDNGEVWRIPARVVAEDRAKYYSELDFGRGHVDDKDAAYEDELQYGMSDDSELLDYLQNNMDWADVRVHAKQVEPAEDYDYGDAFDSAKFEVKAE